MCQFSAYQERNRLVGRSVQGFALVLAQSVKLVQRVEVRFPVVVFEVPQFVADDFRHHGESVGGRFGPVESEFVGVNLIQGGGQCNHTTTDESKKKKGLGKKDARTLLSVTQK